MVLNEVRYKKRFFNLLIYSLHPVKKFQKSSGKLKTKEVKEMTTEIGLNSDYTANVKSLSDVELTTEIKTAVKR